MNPWYVYVIQSTVCKRTYVGATTDPKRRLRQHNGEIKGGARNTRGFRPWKMIRVIGPIETQSEALKEERRIKKLRAKRLNGQDKTIFEEKYYEDR
jgi:structure-specific endonuclease subunit SLX1